MNRVVQKEMSYSLSSEDIHRITEGKCKIVEYRELNQYRSLQEAAGPTEAAICLIETKVNRSVFCYSFVCAGTLRPLGVLVSGG